MPLALELDEIRIASLHREDAERLAALDDRAVAVESIEEAIATSDVVALCTHSGRPVLEPGWVRPGTHVTSVGYREPFGELPRALLERASLFVETRLAFEPTPAGCFELQGLDPRRATELGEVIAGTRPGRTGEDEVTVYKAMGHAVEDLVATELALARADEVDGLVEVAM
jgi:alanine dehydrogenase